MAAYPLPAVCTVCGTVFWMPNFMDVGSATDISFSGGFIAPWPCSKCGGAGRVPDGVYDFIDDTIRVVAAPSHSQEDLRRLAAVLRQLDITALTPELVAAVITEAAPGIAGLSRILPQTKDQLLVYIALLVALLELTLAGAAYVKSGDQLSAEDVARITQKVIERSANPSAPPPPPPPPPTPPAAPG